MPKRPRHLDPNERSLIGKPSRPSSQVESPAAPSSFLTQVGGKDMLRVFHGWPVIWRRNNYGGMYSWCAYSFWYWKGSDRWSSMIWTSISWLWFVCVCFWWFWNKGENTCDLSLRLSINVSNLGCRKQQLRKPRLFGRLSESNLFRVSMAFLGTSRTISGCLLVDSRSRWAVAKCFPLCLQCHDTTDIHL